MYSIKRKKLVPNARYLSQLYHYLTTNEDFSKPKLVTIKLHQYYDKLKKKKKRLCSLIVCSLLKLNHTI